MPHISKESLDTKLYKKLFLQLAALPVGLSKGQTTKLLTALLTPTEQVMLTKRCAAAIMFAEGYSNYRVSTVLKISQSTAARLREQYESGDFDGIVSLIHGRKIAEWQRQEFIDTLNKVLRLELVEKPLRSL